MDHILIQSRKGNRIALWKSPGGTPKEAIDAIRAVNGADVKPLDHFENVLSVSDAFLPHSPGKFRWSDVKANA